MGLLALLSCSTSNPLSPSFSATFPSSSRLPPSALAIAATPISRLHISKPLNGFWVHKPFVTSSRGAMIVKAGSDIKGTGPDGGDTQSESDVEEDLLFGNVPLDSKLQLKLEHKMRMKLGKRVRLRRKKLIHKRRMRKKGKWPPSKMNKLKNV